MNCKTFTNGNRATAWVHALLGVVLAAPLVGCYSSDALVERARNDAIQGRLEEVEIGHFRTTLPRQMTGGPRIEVVVEVFATTKRYRVEDLEAAIEEQEYRLRQNMLIAIRGTTPDEMADPNLTALRERLLAVANELLVEPPVDGLGLREVRFIPL